MSFPCSSWQMVSPLDAAGSFTRPPSYHPPLQHLWPSSARVEQTDENFICRWPIYLKLGRRMRAINQDFFFFCIVRPLHLFWVMNDRTEKNDDEPPPTTTLRKPMREHPSWESTHADSLKRDYLGVGEDLRLWSIFFSSHDRHPIFSSRTFLRLQKEAKLEAKLIPEISFICLSQIAWWMRS